jgi:hypothetical protein
VTYSFVQQTETSNALVSQTVISSNAMTIAANNMLWVMGSYGASTPGAQAVTWANTVTSDGFTQIGTFYSPSAGSGFSWGYYKNISSGSCVVSMAASSNVFNGARIYAAEYSGLHTSSPFVASANSSVAAPGTGSDAITSGSTATLSSWPALVIGFSKAYQGGAFAPTSGTAFTQHTSVWAQGGASTFARPEDKRVTVNAAVAATFRSQLLGTSASYFTVVGVFKETQDSPNPYTSIYPPLLAQ